MKEKLYGYYTSLFGHNKIINVVVNRLSANTIQMGESVDVGKKTRITGDVNIGENVSISPNVKINGDVNIGAYTNLNGDNSIIGEVKIGKYCAIAPRARMMTRDHPTHKPGMQGQFYNKLPADLQSVSKGPIEIGNDVWICSDAKILSNVTVGNGAVIAANSVVVDDVEPYSIVAGNPATHKRYRFCQATREALQKISWWDWDLDKQRRNGEFFDSDLRKTDNIKSLIRDCE